MNKKTRILALLLSVLMLVGVLPLSIFAADEAPIEETVEEAGVLDALAAKATGSLYAGISIPAGTTKVQDTATADGGGSKGKLGVETKDLVYVDSGDGDGSKVLMDTTDSITNANGTDSTKTDITFTYIPQITFKRGADNNRFVVASIKLTAGEALDYAFLRVRAYKRNVTITYDADGNQIGDAVVDTITSGSAGGPYKDDITLYNVSGSDFTIAKKAYNFNSAIYTDFTTVIDTVENTAYFYVNGVEIHIAENFFSKIQAPVTVENDDGTKTVTSTEYQQLDFSGMFNTNNPIAGMFFKSGPIKCYRTSDESKVFDGEGNFIYENNTPANGVFKIGGDYYFFENGFAQEGKTVEYEGYYLELDERTGKILNCYVAENAYTVKSQDELKAAGATIISAAQMQSKYSNTAHVAIDGRETYTAYRYAADGTTVESYEVPARQSYEFVEGKFFRMGFKRLDAPKDSYYASKSNLAKGKLTTYPNTDDITYTFSNPDKVYNNYTNKDFVMRFDAMFGEGINNIQQTNLFRVRFYTSTNATADTYISLKRINGEEKLYIGDVDCNITLEAGMFNNYAFAFDFESTGLYLSIYVNGELRLDKHLLSSDAHNQEGSLAYVDYLGVYIAKTVRWEGDLVTFKPAMIYTGENLDALDFTGFADNGSNVLYYENGAIAKSGNAADVEAYAGKKYAELISYGVELSDVINLCFCTKLGSVVNEKGAYALLKVGDDQEKIMLNTLEKEGSFYKITAKLSSIQIGKEVTLEIYAADGSKLQILKSGASSTAWSYSVQRYAEYIIANKSLYEAETLNLVKAMLNYGAFAERYFEGAKGLATARSLTELERLAVQYGTIGTFYTDVTIASKLFKSTFNDMSDDVNLTASATDVSMLGDVQLVLNSAIKIRIALNVTEAPESIEGGVLYTEEIDGQTKYFVDITGLTAKELNTVKTVVVDGNVIRITALAAANAVVEAEEGTYSKTFTDLMKAMYLYYYYADAYVKANA